MVLKEHIKKRKRGCRGKGEKWKKGLKRKREERETGVLVEKISNGKRCYRGKGKKGKQGL